MHAFKGHIYPFGKTKPEVPITLATNTRYAYVNSQYQHDSHSGVIKIPTGVIDYVLEAVFRKPKTATHTPKV